MKIQQPVTTSTDTKCGQRYWRQPATKPQKQAKPRQTYQRLFSLCRQRPRKTQVSRKRYRSTYRFCTSRQFFGPWTSWPTINSLSDLIHSCQISMASLGILSGSPFRNSLLWLYASLLSLIAHLFLFYYQRSPLNVHPPSSLHFFILPLILPLCGQPGHIIQLAA